MGHPANVGRGSSKNPTQAKTGLEWATRPAFRVALSLLRLFLFFGIQQCRREFDQAFFLVREGSPQCAPTPVFEAVKARISPSFGWFLKHTSGVGEAAVWV